MKTVAAETGAQLIGLSELALYESNVGSHRISRWIWLVPSLSPVIMLAALAGWGLCSFGSVRVGFRVLSGERVIVHPMVATVEVPPSELETETMFRVYNLTGVPLRLTGAESHCTCFAPQGLPKTIPPGETYTFHVVVRSKGRGIRIDDALTLFTDHRGTQSLRLRVRGPASW